MLKGLVLSPPVLGRIAMGRVVEQGGQRRPQADDGFTVTTQVQQRSGWLVHPLDGVLRQRSDATADGGRKLRTIPVRLLFDDPGLSWRSSYTLFDRRTGRPLCVGDGQSCRRAGPQGVSTLPCPAPEACAWGAERGCRPLGRLYVGIDVGSDEGGDVGDEVSAEEHGQEGANAAAAVDELGSFVFRTAGFNSIRTLSARLQYFWAVTGGKLSALELDLKLRGKSTALSHRAPVFYVDLVVRQGLTLAQAVRRARARWQARQDAGVDQAALDEAARWCLAQGVFEESPEEGAALVEEFYPPAEVPPTGVPQGPASVDGGLALKLQQQWERQVVSP